jgi:hypothetical protein
VPQPGPSSIFFWQFEPPPNTIAALNHPSAARRNHWRDGGRPRADRMISCKRASGGRLTKLPLLAGIATACLIAFSLAAFAMLAMHKAILALRVVAPLSIVFVLSAFRKSS